MIKQIALLTASLILASSAHAYTSYDLTKVSNLLPMEGYAVGQYREDGNARKQVYGMPRIHAKTSEYQEGDYREAFYKAHMEYPSMEGAWALIEYGEQFCLDSATAHGIGKGEFTIRDETCLDEDGMDEFFTILLDPRESVAQGYAEYTYDDEVITFTAGGKEFSYNVSWSSMMKVLHDKYTKAIKGDVDE